MPRLWRLLRALVPPLPSVARRLFRLALRQALVLLPAQVPRHLAHLVHQPEPVQPLLSAPEYFCQMVYRLASAPPLASSGRHLRRSGLLPALVRPPALEPILRCELQRLLPLGLPPQSVNPRLLP